MVSVRMVSSRTVNTECGNEEGKQGENLADGVTTVYVTGREFEDIYPVWDWRLVPGTIEVRLRSAVCANQDYPESSSCGSLSTCKCVWFRFVFQVQVPNALPPSCSDVMRDREKLERSDYVGGVSDGTIGCAVMDYHPRGQVHLHRSWFMLDRFVVVTNIGVFIQDAALQLQD